MNSSKEDKFLWLSLKSLKIKSSNMAQGRSLPGVKEVRNRRQLRDSCRSRWAQVRDDVCVKQDFYPFSF